MIEIKNLCKTYGSIKALDNISFDVRKGDILGFLGPNGAGKSTTMNIITGYLSSSSGSVSIAGFDVMKNPFEARKHIGYMPEHPPLYTEMTVYDYLCFISEMKSIPKKDIKDSIDEVMQLVSITHVRDRLINNLSKGYRQRVGLAQALVGNPDVLVLDEPTVGLDPQQIMEMRTLIKSIGQNRTVILSTHILPEVSSICNRVVIINKGKIAMEDTTQNISELFMITSKVCAIIEGPSDSIINAIMQVDNVISAHAHTDKATGYTKYIIESEKRMDVRRAIFSKMAASGFPIIDMRPLDMTLEEIFLQIVTKEVEEK